VFVQPAPQPYPIAPALREAASSVGIPTFNSPNGRMMEGDGGSAIADVRIRHGQRLSVFRSYISPYTDRPNLTVLTHALVTRVTFDGTRASGVEMAYQGHVHRIGAGGEVVLSLGAMHTPKVLMHSGIGDPRRRTRDAYTGGDRLDPLLAHLRRARDDERSHRQRGAPLARGARALGRGGRRSHVDSRGGGRDPALRPRRPRVAARDQTSRHAGGVDVPASAKLFLWLAASGRDAAVFPEPETFDLRHANTSKTLAFGNGIHYCLGAELGKLEAQLALDALTHRFPRLRLVEGQALSFHPNISFRGPQALWVQAT
jgi:hypothetical protein